MFEIEGESKGEYFHISCVSCGQHVNLEYVGKDPVMPQFEVSCASCGEEFTFKVHAQNWSGLPDHAVE